MRIYPVSPVCAPDEEPNLGKAYNEQISYYPADCWLSVQDFDVNWLQPNTIQSNFMYDYVRKYPDTGLFTSYANRTRNCSQKLTCDLIQEILNSNHPVLVCEPNVTNWLQYHFDNRKSDIEFENSLANKDSSVFWYSFANILQAIYGPDLAVLDVQTEISGYHMLFSKATWEQNKFREDLNYLAVDNEFSWGIHRMQKPVRLMKAVLADHYYRRHKDMADTTHLGTNIHPHTGMIMPPKTVLK